MKQLHILNGDSSFHQFDKTQIKGEVLIWREILCEGPTTADVSSDAFWETRRQFLENYVHEFDPELWHQLKEQVQKTALATFEEIVLWFEYDLFCQANLLGALSWIYNSLPHSDTKVSLICVGEHPNYQRLVGLGEIVLEEFEALYPQREQLSQADLTFGDKIWKMYCSDQHEELLAQIKTYPTDKFRYLEMAFHKHQKRFPSSKNGLSEIEAKIVDLTSREARPKHQLIGTLLRTQDIYGFGDLQYAKYIEQLAPILEEKEGKLFVNQLGEQIVQKDLDFNELRKSSNQYGGASLADYRWNESNGSLERVASA